MTDQQWTKLDERTYQDGMRSTKMLSFCLLYFLLVLAGVSIAVWLWL